MSDLVKLVADAIYASQFGTRLAGDFSEQDAMTCARAAIQAIGKDLESCQNSSLGYAGDVLLKELRERA